ncbi:carbon-nitrogen family hydrolase [Alkalibacillus silvisoli]|uniref:Carbon-nitrogen family hydrolase n=1 Tax=Alkalibacillus silvisoli TaxID=392823 RepID=A0ABP3JYJ7_9BACI
MKVALLQMDLTSGEPELNKEKINNKLNKLTKDIDVVVLPELWNTCYELIQLDDIADYEGWDSHAYLSHLARKHSVTIIGGSVAKIGNSGFTNTMYVYDENGLLLKEYSKAHPFPLMKEQKYFIAGEGDGLFEVHGIPSAGLIGYDLLFPEWVRSHAIHGAKVVYLVAQWPEERIGHWRTLIQARAIENQCYIVACNRVGSDINYRFGGLSIVVDPIGEILMEGDDEEDILTVELEINQVDQIRNFMPMFQYLRSDLY